MLHEWAVAILLGLSQLLGVPNTPPDSTHWTQAEWQIRTALDSSQQAEIRLYESESTSILEACQTDPQAFINFPRVIHGAHEVWSVDARGVHNKVLQQGDPSFQRASAFYASPSLACASIPTDSVGLIWRVTSYSAYFARIPYEPRLAPRASFNNFFARTLHIAGVGMAIVLGLFSLTLFAGKVPGRLNAAVTLSALFSAVYFTLTVSDAYGFELSMLTAHRIADLGVWFSILLLAYSLRLENLIGTRFFTIYAAHVAIAVAIIAMADSGDAIQLGTSLPFAISLSLVILPLKKTLMDVYRGRSRRRSVLQSGTLLLFSLGSFNEIFSVSGVLDTPPLFPLAYSGSVFFLALAVNERISDTYRERDYLRAHLESEVERKTLALKEAQAELVQSAKLASLGTLSAGIAHEINNSLNYVNGALQPLERLVQAKMPETDRAKTQNLFSVMKEGLQLTVEIVRSLRSYTGLNQAKFNDVSLRQVAETTLTILRSKLRGRIETEIDIDPSCKVYGSVVGLNQVLMNLVTNAIDAMPEGGKLSIKAQASPQHEGDLELVIADTGAGMDAATQARIFEPFFTTKSVGSGTGLGLHIVMNEVRRHHGQIRVQSTPGQGTRFTVTLPREAPAPSLSIDGAAASNASSPAGSNADLPAGSPAHSLNGSSGGKPAIAPHSTPDKKTEEAA